MRRFPRPSHTEPLFDSLPVSILVMACCVVCPILGVIGIIIYGGYKEHEDGIKSFSNAIFPIIFISVILIFPPILTIINIINGTFVEDFLELLPVFLIGIVDIVFALMYSLSKVFPNVYNSIYNVFYSIKKQLAVVGYIICIIGIVFSCSSIKNEGISENLMSYLFLLCIFSIPLLIKMIKLLDGNSK